MTTNVNTIKKLHRSTSDRMISGVCGGWAAAGFPGLAAATRFGGEEERRDRGRVLQRRAGHLRRVRHAGREQVLVHAGGGVEAVARGQGLDLLHHDAALEAGVDRDLLE